MNRLILLCLFTGSFYSCTLSTHRKYREIMEERRPEDTALFRPSRDFRVLSGDPEQNLAKARDFAIERSPASHDSVHYRRKMNSHSDRDYLESKLTEAERTQYLHYKQFLPSESEKIYFLQLESMEEREDYIRAKSPIYSSPLMKQEESYAIHTKDIILGMSKESVKRSWGTPDRIDVAGDPSFENERWIYRINSKTRYIYFEGGRVEGWKESH